MSRSSSASPSPTSPLFLVDAARLAHTGLGDQLVLDGDEGRHAVQVRRIRVDEVVHLADGEGRVVTAQVVAVEGKDRLDVRVVGINDVPRATPAISVVQAIIKGERGETAVETMTEVGVDRIVPWMAQRCVAKWKAGDTGVDKWRRTAREASKQSRRPWFPTIDDVASTVDVAHMITMTPHAFVLHERAQAALSEVEISDDVVLIVGPEGGLTDEEVQDFVAAGATAVQLGSTVLRASTAGTAAAAVVMARSGRW